MKKLKHIQVIFITFVFIILLVACNTTNKEAENVSTPPTRANTPVPKSTTTIVAETDSVAVVTDEPESEEQIEEEYDPPPCDGENSFARVAGTDQFLILEEKKEIIMAHPSSLQLSWFSLDTGALLQTKPIDLGVSTDGALNSGTHFSTDHSHVNAFFRTEQGTSSAYVPLEDPPKAVGYFPEYVGNYSWSQEQGLLLMNGRIYSFENETSTDQRVFLFNPETKELDYLYESLPNESLIYQSGSWSPMGNRIAYVLTDRTIYRQVMIYDFDTGVQIPISPTEVCAYNPVFSPDGQSIIYQAHEYDLASREITPHIGLSQLNELGQWKTEMIYFPYSSTGLYAWSPDSGRVAFFATISDVTGIYLFDLESRKIELLREEPVPLLFKNSHPVWLNGGDGLGYVVDYGDILEDRDLEYFYHYTNDIASGVWEEVVITPP